MIRYSLILIFQFFISAAANAQVTLTHESNNDCTSPCHSVAVIFVHGLTGTQETWVNTTTMQSFPKLLAEDPALKDNIDVYSVQYASLWNSGHPIVAVTNGVEAPIDALVKAKRYSKVVFVAHSLGGNIAREYLVHVKLAHGHAALGRFPLLITLGTPFDGVQGASLALTGLGSLFSHNEQIRSLIHIHRNDFLQLLESTETDLLEKRIGNRCSPVEYDAVFETTPVGPILVVSRDSATKHATRTAGENFGKNHLELPKPADRHDKVYEWVSNEISLCVAGQSRCKTAPDPGPLCSTGDF